MKVLNWYLIELNQAERKLIENLEEKNKIVTTYFPSSLVARSPYVTQPCTLFTLFESSHFNPSEVVVVHQANNNTAFNTYSNRSNTQANFNRTIHSHCCNVLSSQSINPYLYQNQNQHYTFYPTAHNHTVSYPLSLHHNNSNNSNYCVHDQQYVNLRIKIKPNTFEKSLHTVASAEKTSYYAINTQINSKHSQSVSPIVTQAEAIVTSVATTAASANHQSVYDYLLNNPSANLFTDSGISHFVQLCILTNAQDGNCNVVLMI